MPNQFAPSLKYLATLYNELSLDTEIEPNVVLFWISKLIHNTKQSPTWIQVERKSGQKSELALDLNPARTSYETPRMIISFDNLLVRRQRLQPQVKGLLVQPQTYQRSESFSQQLFLVSRYNYFNTNVTNVMFSFFTSNWHSPKTFLLRYSK